MDTPSLTQARLKELVLYDPTTGVFTRRVSRGPAKAGTVATHPHNEGYLRFKIDGTNYLAHRLAWLYMHGVWPQATIDHKNGSRADNRWANLREATLSENAQNKTTPSGQNPYLGVTWHAGGAKWKAAIKHKGRDVYLGVYASAEEAAYAYRVAKAKLHPYAPRKPAVRIALNNRARTLTKQKVDEILAAFDWGIEDGPDADNAS